MAVKNHIIWLLPTLLVSLIFFNQAVFADELSISISSNTATINVAPGQWGTASQTITAHTDNATGYSVNLITTGPSTDLINQSDSNEVIPTFATTLSVSSLTDGYGFSTDNGSTFNPVPEPFTPGVKIFDSIVAGTNTHTLTFGAKVPLGAIAGVYTNTFDIVILANPGQCPIEHICYYGNGDDGTGTMDFQSGATSNTDVTLTPPNYSRPGYGFVSWNTAIDGSGTNYGPSETIHVGELSSEGLILYAKWIASSGNLQGWRGCGRLNTGDVVALTDTRDGGTYAVAKFEDGECWMTENLRLDLSNPNLTIDATNTNAPLASFVTAINNHPSSSNAFCQNNTDACTNQVLFNTNNINRNMTTASPTTNDNSSSWYSYGVYYNWYTASAGHGLRALVNGETTSGDICPAGWRLPTGYGSGGEFATQDVAMGGSGINYGSNAAGLAATKRWRAYPHNFVYSGEQRNNTSQNRGASSSYASKNATTNERTANLWIKPDSVSMNSNGTPKYRGQTVRCITTASSIIMGDIVYDANGGTGTTPGATDVDFRMTPAAINQFTRSSYVFSHWNTADDDSGTVVLENGSLSAAVNDLGLQDGDTLTLYAIWKPKYTLVYDGNSATTGSMTTANIDNLQDGALMLTAPNLLKTGYGFAGWSLDDTAGAKLANGQSVSIYGPNQTITVDNTFLANADASNQITLYAVWLPEDATYTMQTFGTTQCGLMSTGDVIALRDTRDNNTYTVSKLADNHCWMAENLRLVPTGIAFDSTNTNSPTQDFIDDAPSAVSSNTLCNTDNDVSCINQVAFNAGNVDSGLTPSSSENNVASLWYGYGVMYNWYTATAGNGTQSMASGSVTGDICPGGWRLPTGGSSGEFVALNTAINNGYTNKDIGLVKFPANFVYSGDYNNKKPGGRGNYARYWSATASTTAAAYRLGFASSTVTPANAYSKWDAFAIRCIVK